MHTSSIKSSMLKLGKMHLTAALATLVDCGVLETIPKDGSIGSKELADAAKLDESIVRKRDSIV